MRDLDEKQLQNEILDSEKEMDERALRLWERIKITPAKWSQKQYPRVGQFWVVGIVGQRCLFFNPIEYGWGWGIYEEWGEIYGGHCQTDEIHHTIYQILYAIDNGGNG